MCLGIGWGWRDGRDGGGDDGLVVVLVEWRGLVLGVKGVGRYVE